MGTIRWGIIGCGDVTEVKSGPAFQKIENSQLVAVMRRNGELAADYARRHNVSKSYDDADKLINDPEVNAVYIATPPAFHKEYTLKCAKAGKPVYVEKPMAVTYKDCLEMIETCQEHNVPLFVAYYRRALDYFIKVKEIVDDGVIGDVRFVNVVQYKMPESSDISSWRIKPEISGGGLFYDLAPHTLDILDFILGPIIKAEGNSSNQAKLYDAEDIVTAFFEFSSGVQGTGIWCFSAFKNFDVNEIVGSKGKISFSTFSYTPIVLETCSGTREYSFINPPHIQQPLIQSVVNELNSCGKSPSNGISAARTNWVMEEILKHRS
jgi:predicted dehydrogenase